MNSLLIIDNFFDLRRQWAMTSTMTITMGYDFHYDDYHRYLRNIMSSGW